MRSNDVTAKTNWLIDQENSEIGFSIRHLVISSVKGEFKTFDARITTTGRNFSTARIEFWIDTASITTNHVKRDRHLKSKDFFDVKNHRHITFASTSIGVSDSNGDHDMWGDLSMMGVTQKIKLKVHFGGVLYDHSGYERAAFSVSGIINRCDWGLTWNASSETEGLVIGDEVAILCEVELTNKVHAGSEMQSEMVGAN
ncbi:MAG: YceI family protein [Mariniphaga sp.]|nr:YceI family protein [Mariniphaga sp.]